MIDVTYGSPLPRAHRARLSNHAATTLARYLEQTIFVREHGKTGQFQFEGRGSCYQMEILGNNGNNCIKNITWKIIRAKLLRSHRYIFHRYATGPLRTQPECSSSSSLKTHIMFMFGIGFLSQFGCSLCALERLANIKASKTHYSSSKGSGP